MLYQKPIVTFAGDKSVFSNLEPGLSSGLPTEAVEWRRSYGRTSRQVNIECSFQPWTPDAGTATGDIHTQPVFHTYWTDVMDMDQYRQGVKEDIISWLARLRKTSSATDWMIVLVETPEGRKGNKFPLRATVLDKLKQDVGGKTPERCVAVMDPGKADSRAAESMQSFMHKFRQLFLQSYNKVLNKFEENIRGQREKRNEPTWNFCQYFLLQEELAFVYENLGLYDEALIQYDELDAMFTQFILNSSVGESPDWLEKFNKDLSDWSPLSLDTDTNLKLRTKLENGCPSLMDMRNYLFSRQCHQLLLSQKPSEVASRTISFLHNTAQELEILEVKELVSGSLDSWVVLACLEVVATCPQNTGGEEAASAAAGAGLRVATAALWALAREKLLALGRVCGLMPGEAPSSEQLHTVISITGCLPDSEDAASPCRRLKESLTSNAAFQRNYLEMCEIAISSYKFIGRIRSARLVGRDLASFYIQMGEYVQATTFLVEALKTFQQEKWLTLSLQTMLDLAECYRTMRDTEKYARMCAQIASCPAASQHQRSSYFDEFTAAMREAQETVVMSSDDIFNFTSCTLTEKVHDQIVPGDKLTFALTVHNNLPKQITCDSINIALAVVDRKAKADEETEAAQAAARKPVARSPSVVSATSVSEISLDAVDAGPGEAAEEGEGDLLDMVEQLDYKQDKSLCSARLVCRNTYKVLKRKDSSGSMLRDAGQLQRGDYTQAVWAESVVLEPGTNTVTLETEAGAETGDYTMVQMALRVPGGEALLEPRAGVRLYSVATTAPAVSLDKEARELYAGLDNTLLLRVHTGSQLVAPGTTVTLQASRGLQMRGEADAEFSDQVDIKLAGGGAHQTLTATVHVKCCLLHQKDASTIEHKVKISDPWSPKAKDVFIHFTPAFYTTFSLLTAMDKKFLQVFVFPVGDNSFVLSGHQLSLSAAEDQLTLTPINSDEDVLVTDSNCEAGYLWQLNIAADSAAELSSKLVKATLTLNYKEKSRDSGEEKYEASFQFQNFLTLYTIQAKVEPSKGSEFCRAGTMCPMTILLEQCNVSPYTNLYYEVGLSSTFLLCTAAGMRPVQVIADQAVWAVCGRQGAVVTLAAAARQNIVVEVMPLVGGHLPLPSIRLSKVTQCYTLQLLTPHLRSTSRRRARAAAARGWTPSPAARCTTCPAPSRCTCCPPAPTTSRGTSSPCPDPELETLDSDRCHQVIICDHAAL